MTFPFCQYDNPLRLYSLIIIPILLVVYIIIVRMRAKQGMRYTNTTVLGEVLPKQSQWLRHVIVALSVLSLAFLGTAWGRPIGTDYVPQERATVVMIIDVSYSMTATDVPPSRMAAAKQAAIDFVNDLPDGFNVALVSMSGHSALRLPPTQDHSAVARAIDVLSVEESSAVGDAIMAALTAIDLAPRGDDGSVAPGMIVLLSDGDNNTGQAPLQTALEAKEKEIPIFTIAFGTENGYVDLDDERFHVPPNPDLMKEIAQMTNGDFFSADNIGQLKGAYGKIKSSLGWVEVKKEITARIASYGLMLALVAAVGAVMMGVKFR